MIKYFCDNCDVEVAHSLNVVNAANIMILGSHGTNMVSISIRYGVPKLDQGNLCDKCILQAVTKVLKMEEEKKEK